MKLPSANKTRARGAAAASPQLEGPFRGSDYEQFIRSEWLVLMTEGVLILHYFISLAPLL